MASMQAWDLHMTGLERLVSMRGPQLCQLPFGQELLENIRFLLVNADVIRVLVDQD